MRFGYHQLIPTIISCFSIIFCTGKGLKVCFHINEMNERGTAIFVYNFAHYNEIILENKSVFVCPDSTAIRYGITRNKFETRFGSIQLYNQFTNFSMTQKARSVDCDLLYLEKHGLRESAPAFSTQFGCSGPPIAVHAGFFWEKHGSAFAMLTEDQAKPSSIMGMQNYYTYKQAVKFWDNFVPLIVEPATYERKKVKKLLKSNNSSFFKDYRKLHNISESALVICRHGGYRTFNDKHVQEVVCSSARKHGARLHYLFLGTSTWGSCSEGQRKSSNVHFLKTSVDRYLKESYFASCDVMLHARPEGEIMSVAIAEASVRGIPVLHRIIKDTPVQPIVKEGKAILYKDSKELMAKIDSLVSQGVPAGDYNAYRNFSPEHVMKRFERIFINGAFEGKARNDRFTCLIGG